MSPHGPPKHGGRRCGQVRFTVFGRPLLTMACHCTGCQRMTPGGLRGALLIRLTGSTSHCESRLSEASARPSSASSAQTA
jgi:hypothetical protein